MSNQSEEQPFQVVSRRNYGGISRKGPKTNNVKPAPASNEEGLHRTNKLRPTRDVRSRSQSSHLNQERQRRDSDRQSTGERSRHNSTRGTSSDDLEFESSQEKDCPVANGTVIPDISPNSARNEQMTPPAEVVPAETTPARCVNSTEASAPKCPEVCTSRITYSREFLLSLKGCTYNWPKLVAISVDCIKSDGNKQRNQSPTDHTEESRRHPTAVTLIKENDSKVPHRVSLSPHRRSFGGGCSWKDASSGGATPTEEVEARNARQSKDRQWDSRGKDKRVTKQLQPKSYKHEEEPEWLEFGPNDRFEIIELKGLEEHERGREEVIGKGGGQRDGEEEDEKGRKDSCGDDEFENGKQGCPKPRVSESESKDGVEQEMKKGEEKPDFTKCEELETKEATPVCSEKEVCVPEMPPHTEPLRPIASLQDEDNFIVDGFDFSTGVSICLAMDEELEDSGHKAKNGITDTTALFKMMQLKDGADDLHMQRTRPINALTLEEIQAIENITTPTSQTTQHDHMPFNQILAVLSGGTSQPSGVPTLKPPNLVPSPPMPVAMTPSTLPPSSNFAYHLDGGIEDGHTHHLPPDGQHRGSYLHHVRPSPRAPNRTYANDQQLSWGLADPLTKPPSWGDEERARQHHIPASQSQSNWISDMEQRRLMEAKQVYGPSPRTQVKKSPGISLLPTSVMKHMYNTKMNQRVPDVAMATGMDKLDPAEVPFTVRDYTVQSPQHYSAPLYPPSGPMYYPMLGQQYNRFPGYPPRHPSPYSR